MKELTGLNADTPKNLMFGPGKGYFDIDITALRDSVETDPVGAATATATAIGATRGGFELSVTPEMREIEVDGSRGLTKGMRRLLSMNASTVVNFAELTADNLVKMVPGGKVITHANGLVEITGGDLTNESYIDNVAFLCTYGEREIPAVLVIENALADGGVSLTFADNDEGTPAVTFNAHYDPTDPDKQPWAIFLADDAA